MTARLEIRQATGDPIRIARARQAVHQAKIALGERGPVWWEDGAPDYNRHMAVNTPYANWFQALEKRRKRDVSKAPRGPARSPLRRKRTSP